MSKKKLNKFHLAKFSFLFSLVAITGLLYFNKRAEYLHGKNILYPLGQVLGIESVNTQLTVDYSQQIGTGNPEVFGGAHGPRLQDTEAWDMLKKMGVTTLKRDINFQYEAPLKTTVDDYIKNNLSNQNTDSFNLDRINETRKIYKNARERGIKTMAVTAFMPTWLSLNGKNNGLPKDWNVYEDIVRKIYKIHRPYLDYIEISNEPDLNTFLSTEGTTLSRQEAYLQLFLHTSKAIRQVDQEMNDGKKMKIGGGITSEPNQPSYLEALLKNTEAKNNLQFVSYHTYGHEEPTSARTKTVLKKYGAEKLPIFISEWNKSSSTSEYNPFHNSEPAITYTGGKFIDFLNEGYGGANYFTLSNSDKSRPNTVFSVFGIYENKDGKTKPFPQTKTWTVLSMNSRLGRGLSTIYRTAYDTDTKLKVVAFKNVDKTPGLAISNPTTTAYSVTVTLNNLDLPNEIKMLAYEASSNWDASKTKGTLVTNLSDRNQIQVFVAPMTLVSVLIQ